HGIMAMLTLKSCRGNDFRGAMHMHPGHLGGFVHSRGAGFGPSVSSDASALKSRHFFALPSASHGWPVKPLATMTVRHNGVAVDLFKCPPVFAIIRMSLQMPHTSIQTPACRLGAMMSRGSEQRGERPWRIFSDGCPLQSLVAR